MSVLLSRIMQPDNGGLWDVTLNTDSTSVTVKKSFAVLVVLFERYMFSAGLHYKTDSSLCVRPEQRRAFGILSLLFHPGQPV